MKATEQQMDPLIWKDQKVVYASGPSFKGAPLSRKMDFDLATTANLKGFTATWEIKDDVLYLKALAGRIDGKQVSDRDFFPGKNLPILADWFSGTIIIAAGDKIGTTKRGQFRSVYATEIHLFVIKGKVTHEAVKNFSVNDPEVRGLDFPIVSDTAKPRPGEPIPAQAFR